MLPETKADAGMMFESELLMLVLAICVVIFSVIQFKNIRKIPDYKILMSSYYCLFAGIFVTVFENFYYPEISNIVEHFCYTVSSLFLFAWCYRLKKNRKVSNESDKHV